MKSPPSRHRYNFHLLPARRMPNWLPALLIIVGVGIARGVKTGFSAHDWLPMTGMAFGFCLVLYGVAMLSVHHHKA